MKMNSSNSFFGIYIAVKLIKNPRKGANFMSLMYKDMVLTTKEAIEYLKISKPTLLKYIRLGRIRATKVGNGWRIHQYELYRFLEVGERLTNGF
jgi:excisionase family DNA binding protein